ncbi:hypothetical protein [Kitasatospora sp. NBC_01300]|uniref:hypothetical protein n=1 Tax=Kitasatospora sp. NBC_01300 TaxID=2903574 RepID=UPI002F909865|nr:hypothetical protein OG556_34310 [Kitasatospora sp. NBC_01300]
MTDLNSSFAGAWPPPLSRIGSISSAAVDPGPCTSWAWPTAHCQVNSLTSCDCGYCTAYGPLPGHTAHHGT